MDIIYPKGCIAWDLETSGLVPATSKILEIGAMSINSDGEVTDRRSWLLNHGIQISEETTRITGITQELIDRDGIDPIRALTDFIEFLGTGAHLTHNGIRFDIPFLIESVRQILPGYNEDDLRYLRHRLYKQAIDSAVMVKAKKLGVKRYWNEDFKEYADRVMQIKAFGVKYNVGLCCDEMGIDRSQVQQHRAMGDIELTYQIYRNLIEHGEG